MHKGMTLRVKHLEGQDISTLTAAQLGKAMRDFPDGVIVPCKGGLASFSRRQSALGLTKKRGLVMSNCTTFVEFTLEDNTLVLVNAPDSAEDGQRHVLFVPVLEGGDVSKKILRIREELLRIQS